MQALVSRLISPFVAAFLLWLLNKGIKIDVSADEITTFIVIPLMIAIYGASHKLIDKFMVSRKEKYRGNLE